MQDHRATQSWQITVAPNAGFSALIRDLYPDDRFNIQLLGRDVLKSMSREVAAEMIQEALSDLPERQRLVLILSCGLDGQPPRTAVEVGAILERSPRAISSMKYRALIRLSNRIFLDRRVRELWPKDRFRQAF